MLPLGDTSRVYSLAASLIPLLEGRRLFDHLESMIQMLADIALKGLSWAEPRNPGCPGALHAVLRRATALDPSARYPTLAEFLQALRANAGVEPAPEARMIDVLLGVSPAMQSALGRVEGWALPPSWASGGIQVMQDRLLERLVPVSALPPPN